jgi:putative copper export protein
MARDVFSEDFEDKTDGNFGGDPFSKKKLTATMVEKAGWIMAVVIMLVVIAVMTLDIKTVTIHKITELSLTAFLLLFCSYAMYGNMYHTGMLEGHKLDSYKKAMAKYDVIRDEIRSKDVWVELRQFCAEFVQKELRECIEDRLYPGGVTYEEYLKYHRMTKKEMRRKRLPERKIKAILDANWVSPMSFTAEMLYKAGSPSGWRLSPMHMSPRAKKTMDYGFTLFKTVFTSVCMCFIAFEMFTVPSWETFVSVVVKLFAVAMSGYSGYRNGYSLVTTEITYTEDRIEYLEQFKEWRAAKNAVVFENSGGEILPAINEVKV